MASTLSSSPVKKKKKIVLRSSDGNDFEVDEDVAMESNTIKNMLEDLSDSEAIPLPNVTGKILSKVIEYCKKHVETRKSDDRFAAHDIKDWDTAFTKDLIHDQETLFDLMVVRIFFIFLQFVALLSLIRLGFALIRLISGEIVGKSLNLLVHCSCSAMLCFWVVWFVYVKLVIIATLSENLLWRRITHLPLIISA